jgi:hypothetical protein
MALIEYKITENEIKEEYGFNISARLLNRSYITPIINLAYNEVITLIHKWNDNIKSNEDIYNLLDTEDKIEAFKFCQYKVVFNELTSEGNPIDQTILDTIRFRMRISLINGVQR